DKANGSAVIDDLKSAVGGLVPVKPEGGKEARAAVVQPYAEAGNIYLPDPSIAPWVEDYIAEFQNFPKGAHDDQVDATSQAIVWLRGRITKSGFYVSAVRKCWTPDLGEPWYRDRFGKTRGANHSKSASEDVNSNSRSTVDGTPSAPSPSRAALLPGLRHGRELLLKIRYL